MTANSRGAKECVAPGALESNARRRGDIVESGACTSCEGAVRPLCRVDLEYVGISVLTAGFVRTSSAITSPFHGLFGSSDPTDFPAGLPAVPSREAALQWSGQAPLRTMSAVGPRQSPMRAQICGPLTLATPPLSRYKLECIFSKDPPPQKESGPSSRTMKKAAMKQASSDPETGAAVLQR